MDKDATASYLFSMRPLVHPSSDDISLEGILHALADPIRRRIYADIATWTAPQGCSPFLEIDGKAIPKSTLSQHFKILREAGLIRSERRGPGLISVPRTEDLRTRFGTLIEAVLSTDLAEASRPAATIIDGETLRKPVPSRAA